MSRGKHVDPSELEGVPLTMEAVFDNATQAAVNGRATIEFDPDHGFPKRVGVHYDRPDSVRYEAIEVVSFSPG